jgi:hypothetical protein
MIDYLELTFADIHIAATCVLAKGNSVRRTVILERTFMSISESLAVFSTSREFKECCIEQASFQFTFYSVMIRVFYLSQNYDYVYKRLVTVFY